MWFGFYYYWFELVYEHQMQSQIISFFSFVMKNTPRFYDFAQNVSLSTAALMTRFTHRDLIMSSITRTDHYTHITYGNVSLD